MQTGNVLILAIRCSSNTAVFRKRWPISSSGKKLHRCWDVLLLWNSGKSRLTIRARNIITRREKGIGRSRWWSRFRNGKYPPFHRYSLCFNHRIILLEIFHSSINRFLSHISLEFYSRFLRILGTILLFSRLSNRNCACNPRALSSFQTVQSERH